MQDRIDLVVGGVTAEAVELRLEHGLPGHQPIELRTLRGGHAFEDLVEFLLDLIEAAERGRSGAAQGVRGIELGFLLEVADPDPALQADRAVVGLDATRDDLEERALAAAVAAHETDLLAFIDAEHHVLEEDVDAVSEADVVDGDQAHRGGECRGATFGA